MKKTFTTEMKNKLLKEKARVEKELSCFTHRIDKKSEKANIKMEESQNASDKDHALKIASFSHNLSLESTLERYW